ncbi:MAG: hypothetical protein MJ053_03630 [Elusimicrobiaceae bacterium]|nr:hypothetical protein [Elusimicrobiaceae bacterium]
MMKKFFILCILGLFLEGGGFCQEAVVKSISRTPARVTDICNRAMGKCTSLFTYPGLGVSLAQRRVSAYVQAGKAVKNQSALAKDMDVDNNPFKNLDGRRFLDFYRKINPDGVELRTNQQALN